MFTRTERGVSLVETAASLTILLPIVVLCILAGLQIIQICLLQSTLSDVAHSATRQLSIAYWKDPTIASNPGMQASVFSQFRIKGVINTDSQFEDVIFDTSGDYPKVSVVVRYSSGNHGLPKLPSFPLPLSDFTIVSKGSHCL